MDSTPLSACVFTKNGAFFLNIPLITLLSFLACAKIDLHKLYK